MLLFSNSVFSSFIDKENFMFDAQSLLGGLLKEVISGGKSDSNLGGKAAVGMGALGVAIAAFEHFTQEKNSSAQTAVNNSRPAPPSGQIPQPPGQGTAPPPAPPPSPSPMSKQGAAPVSAPPPMPASALSEGRKVFQETALVLIDAMLASANADGHIDTEEKSKILKQLKQINSDQEGYDYVQQRIDNPPTLEQVCQSTSDPEIAKQIYMVSLLAITVDTTEEADYLKNLASCLPVDTQVIAQLNEQFQTKE